MGRERVILGSVELRTTPALGPLSLARPNPLGEKLQRYGALGQHDLGTLDRLCRNRKNLLSNLELAHEGHRLRTVYMIVTGVAYRYKFLANGRRQILGYLLPGDLCDVEFLLSNYCDHTVSLLTDAEVATIPAAELAQTIRDFPSIGRALMQAAAVEGAMLREWLLNVGQRDSVERIAHLFCELAARMQCLGEEGDDLALSIPLTQVELADSVGLTVVHVNRCLQRLRAEKLIAWNRRRLTILDHERLRRVAGFDKSYLKLGRSAQLSGSRQIAAFAAVA